MKRVFDPMFPMVKGWEPPTTKYAFDPSEEEINNLTKSMNQFGLTEQESKRFIDVMEKKSMRKRIKKLLIIKVEAPKQKL